jgi:hypothetical protein
MTQDEYVDIATTDAERSYGVTASEAFEVVTEYCEQVNESYSEIQKMTRQFNEDDVRKFFKELSTVSPSYMLKVIALYLELGKAAKLLEEANEQMNNIKNGVCKPSIQI